jgi:hypothetical protein
MTDTTNVLRWSWCRTSRFSVTTSCCRRSSRKRVATPAQTPPRSAPCACPFRMSRRRTVAPSPTWPGSREYRVDPDEMVGFVDKAEVLVMQFAPVLGQMLDRMPLLKLIAVSRGGPVNIDMAAALQCGVRVRNASGRNASRINSGLNWRHLNRPATDGSRTISAQVIRSLLQSCNTSRRPPPSGNRDQAVIFRRATPLDQDSARS